SRLPLYPSNANCPARTSGFTEVGARQPWPGGPHLGAVLTSLDVDEDGRRAPRGSTVFSTGFSPWKSGPRLPQRQRRAHDAGVAGDRRDAEAELAADRLHGNVVGKDVGDERVEPLVARDADQLPQELGPQPAALVGVADEQRELRLVGARH